MKQLTIQICACILAILSICLIHGSGRATLSLPAPTLISPISGNTIITPTFKWGGSPSDAKYEVQVAADAAFTTLLWSGETKQQTLTPITSIPNGDLHWRVRAKDSDNNPGAWSSVGDFVKHIPAPTLVAPGNGVAVTVITPSFQWQAAQGATYYQIEVATDDSFTADVLVFQATTFDLSITPTRALPNGQLFWRVKGMDAGDHAGTVSATWTFTKVIPGPALVSPADGITVMVITPSFQWQAASGAVYYHLQVATNDSFTSDVIVWEEDTYDLSITPVTSDFPNTVLYWHVRGMDGQDHPGAYSTTRRFTRHIPAPNLIEPINGDDVQIPTFHWTASDGATYYEIQVARGISFTSDVLLWTQDTHDLQITPVDIVNPKAWPTDQPLYWRIRGMDTRDNPGTYSVIGNFTLSAQDACTNTTLTLISPAQNWNGTTDPNFEWGCYQGAAFYKVRLFKPDLAHTYDTINTKLTAYTPYAAPNAVQTLINGQYLWKIEAWADSTHKLAESETRTFTKAAILNLLGPTDGATLPADPTFSWARVQGAVRYKLEVYTGTTILDLYDYVYTEYPTYTPFNAPNARQTYVNGNYKWKVLAYRSLTTSEGEVIATSDTREVRRQTTFDLIAPADGSSVAQDPTFQWEPVQGARRYKLEVYVDSNLYDSLYTDYTTYTPYDTGSSKQTYINNNYSWKVIAYRSTSTSNSEVIAISKSTRQVRRASVLNLLSPADKVHLCDEPTFSWQSIIGARRYKLEISQHSTLYDSIYTEYPEYTPYDAPDALSSFADGDFSWRVLAFRSKSTGISEIITTSVQTRAFELRECMFLPITVRQP